MFFVDSLLFFFLFFFFFFNDTATTEIYTLSLHDALPISPGAAIAVSATSRGRVPRGQRRQIASAACRPSISGISTSIRTASYASLATASTWCPSLVTIRRIVFWFNGLSSATRTFRTPGAGAGCGASATSWCAPTCAITSWSLCGGTGLVSVACTTPLSAAPASPELRLQREHASLGGVGRDDQHAHSLQRPRRNGDRCMHDLCEDRASAGCC